MPEKEKEKEIKPKEPTVEEQRKELKNELGFFRDITNYVKQMKDNGCINPMIETDVKNMIEERVRQILGLPAKPAVPQYIPPQPAGPPQYQPGQQPYYPPRPG